MDITIPHYSRTTSELLGFVSTQNAESLNFKYAGSQTFDDKFFSHIFHIWLVLSNGNEYIIHVSKNTNKAESLNHTLKSLKIISKKIFNGEPIDFFDTPQP